MRSSLLSSPSDRERAPHRQQRPAAGQRVGGDPGIGDEAQGGVWLRLHRHQKPGQQLLPVHDNAGPLQHPRVPEDVSILQ